MSGTADRHRTALDVLLELVLLVNDDMTRSLARDGLTNSRTHVMWELAQRGPTTQRDLAEALAVSPRTVTGLVDGLAATGFVTREPHPTDRRATLVTFTPRGADTAAALVRGQHEFADLLFAGLPDERLDCLVTGMRELLDRLRAHGPEPAPATTEPATTTEEDR
ncbi:MarR family winged helix-turn-helix transcriptional regulator [Polymorphospora rubra]|uniref:MarR family winged helix-turn-helix transcriptional regulator n=1 Tax=Polymorphospora rubra TaxID=338584 RepID=UPI0033C022EC